jgi:hypothetical protein
MHCGTHSVLAMRIPKGRRIAAAQVPLPARGLDVTYG